jgi:protein TonB
VIQDRRLIVCALLSIAGHFAFARGLSHLPRRVEVPIKRTISIRVVAPPPPLEEPPPEPTQPQPKTETVPHERPRARPTPAAAHDVVPKDVPPAERPPTVGDSTTPVFGVTMESTSEAGGGPSLPIGNAGPSARPRAPTEAAPQALAPPVAAYEVTTMPLPQGRCSGKYTDEAKHAAIEGTVVLDLVVGETGRVREVHVVSGLGFGLTEAAIAAAKECRFSPGEKDGVAVPVRVRGFKIRFLLDGGE